MFSKSGFDANAAFTFHHTYLIKSAVADSQLFRVLQQQTTLIHLVFEKSFSKLFTSC